MIQTRSPVLCLRARGTFACFTRPELKVERVSYPVMTPSAARGLLEAILWKPAIVWRVERIKVLSEIRFTAFRRNEVNSKAVAPASRVVHDGGPVLPFFIEEDRAQRNTIALRDVDYLIEAHFDMTGKAGPEDNVNKFAEMFRRRLEKGQHYHQPYLGCREFPAEVLPADDAPLPVNDSRGIGIMLWDISFGPQGNRPLFFEAHLEAGVLEVPEEPSFTPLAAAGGAL
ncbi:type I-C CRISPR-associated protein Cas5c [bacterium]|nr:type I-C CRISPR-associated protein Cas5c [bacterium]